MAAALEDTPVSYEQLADIEREFEDVETEIIRQQIALTAPLYEKRNKTVSQIPNFWPLVLEQAPPDIDQYIQPSDSALILSSLKSLSISRFEAANGGDPRSFAIKFEFSENEYFEDTVLEKKFWYRRAKDGWDGLVSEPVKIQWKKEKDLTQGLLDLVVKVWESEKPSGKKIPDSPERKELAQKIQNSPMGGLSFFAWFGFIGRRVTAEESAQATKLDKEKREARQAGKSVEADAEGDQVVDLEEFDLSLEIFLEGDDLAIAITDDLWPGAIKYFTQAQEQDALSDMDFESDDEDALGEDQPSDDDDDEDEPPKKKSRAS